MTEKKCKQCNLTKSIETFNKKTSNGKIYSWCEPCRKEYTKIYVANNWEKVKSNQKLYRDKNKEKIREIDIKYKTKFQTVLKSILRRLKKIDISCDIDIEYLYHLYFNQNARCAITGLEFNTQPYIGTKARSISVDRIDNSIGYRKGNIRLICFMVNVMRNRFSDREVLEMASAIVFGPWSKTDGTI